MSRRTLVALTLALVLLITAISPLMAQEPPQEFTWADDTALLTTVPCCQSTVDRNTRWLLDQLFDGLIDYAPESSEIVPNLAESWDVSDDGLTWTFHLREGVTFSNGDPLTAGDVKYSIDLALGPESKVMFRIGGLQEIAVVDDLTLTMTTEAPNSALIHALQEVAGLVQSPQSTPDNPIGTGPYVLNEWNRGENVVLELRSDYWETPPNLQKQVYLRRPEPTTRVIQLLNGEIGMAAHLPPETLMDLQNVPGVEAVAPPSSMLVGIRLNSRVPPYDNVLIRQGMNYAINKKAIVDNLLMGAAYVPDGIAGHGVWGTVMLEDGYYPYDLEKAEALFKEAGLEKQDGMWQYEGEPLVFRLYVPEGRYMKDRVVGEYVAQALRDFGIDVQLEVAPWSIWANNSRARANALEIDGGMNGFSLPHPILNWAYDLHCDQKDARQTGHCDPAFDALINQAQATFEEEEQRELYAEAQQMAIENASYLLLYGQSPVYGVRDNVKGLQFSVNEIPITTEVVIE